MAVVANPPFKTNLDRWGSGDSAILYPGGAAPASMTEIMPYQYPPPPPQNGADLDLPPPPGYLNNYPAPPPPPSTSSSGIEADPRSSSRDLDLDRRDSLSKAMKLKRSVSSSNVRPPQQPQNTQQQQIVPPPPTQQQRQAMESDQAALALAGEKKRNKLGYHRTSVACGHCRRRKIRCIPSPNDMQGRCINCIRLKKECSFYPVDQPPPPQDTRQKSASRSSVGPKIGSASSSPAMQTGIPSDVHGQGYSMTMPSIQTMAPPMKPAGSESFSPDPKMPSSASSTRGYDYGNHSMTNWMSDASPNSSKPGDLSATWRTYPSESPITPAFSPYTPHAPPSSATWAPGDSTSRDDMAWSSYPPAPSRSLSFGAETMSGHPQGQASQYPAISQIGSHSIRSYDRKSGASMAADMYPAPITTSMAGMESVPVTSLEHTVSLSAGAVPPSSYGSWGQQSYPYAKQGDGYGASGGWYGEHGAQQAPGDHGGSGQGLYYPER